MKRLWLIALLTLLASTLGCHRGADFRRYVSGVQRVTYSTAGVPQLHIDLGHRTTGRNVVALAARQIGGGVAEIRLQEKLSAAIQPATLGDQLRSSLQDALALRMRFNAVADPEPCDAWIETTISDYGIRADSPDSLPFVVLSAQLVMYDCAARSAVWDSAVQFVEPITNPFFRIERISTSAGVIANMAALEALTPQEWSELYRAAAATAGARLAEQLVKAASGKR